MENGKRPEKLWQHQVAAVNSPTDRQEWVDCEMRTKLEKENYQEGNLVQLYQDIMQCEKIHAKSVYILLIDVAIEIAPFKPFK